MISCFRSVAVLLVVLYRLHKGQCSNLAGENFVGPKDPGRCMKLEEKCDYPIPDPRKCCDGLSCEPFFHKCYHERRQFGEPCSGVPQCDTGLSCRTDPQDLKLKCFHVEGRMGEPCTRSNLKNDPQGSCQDGLTCHSVVSVCGPGREFDIHNDVSCKGLFDKDKSERVGRQVRPLLRDDQNKAKETEFAYTEGAVTSAGAGVVASFEIGTAYGPSGEFGCYKTECIGGQLDVSADIGYAKSVYYYWGSIAGTSVLAEVGVGPDLGLKIDPGTVSGLIFAVEGGNIIGWSQAYTVGWSLVPFVTVGSVKCETDMNSIPVRELLDANDLKGYAEEHDFKVNAVYTTNWAQWRSSGNAGRPEFCDKYAYEPKHLDGSLYTHIFYAFAMVTPSFEVVDLEENESELIEGLPGGPEKLISIGGWSFSRSKEIFEGTDAKTIFPAMARSSTGRATFIASAIDYAKRKGFQGIDLDWEYPNYEKTANTQRERGDFTTLLKEMYPECKAAGLLLTAATKAINTEPHYELAEIHKYLDWINLMSYDFYGGSFPGTTIAQVHTPVQDCRSRWCGKPFDISTGLEQYLEAGVPRHKLVFGLGTYGRTFKLANPGQENTAPGRAAAVGPAPGGDCTIDDGVLAWYEIKRELEASNPKPSNFLGPSDNNYSIDKHGLAAYVTYGPNKEYWVGFDTPETLHSKVCYAASQRLQGTMAWDGELDDDQELLRSIRESWENPRTCDRIEPEECPDPPADLECEATSDGGDGGGSDGGSGGNSPGGDCIATYTIKSGDTCWKLWTDNDLSQEQFMQLNPGLECSALPVGESVCLSSGGGRVEGAAKGGSGGCSVTHTIQSGDTCWKLWTDNDLSQEQFMQLNPGLECSALPVGESVCLSSGGGRVEEAAKGGSGGCSVTHTIQSGDTCWKLWTDNDLSQEQFMQLNPGLECSALPVGESVCLSN